MKPPKVLIVALSLTVVVSGLVWISYDTARASDDDMSVEYAVHTYDPICTVKFLDDLNGVERLTALEKRYVEGGMLVHISVDANMTDGIVETIFDGDNRTYSVQRMGEHPDGPDAKWPVSINPDADLRREVGHCYPDMAGELARLYFDVIVAQDQLDYGVRSDDGFGPYRPHVQRYGEEPVARTHVPVFISMISEETMDSMAAYVENNNGVIMSMSSWVAPNGAVLNQMTASVPIILLPSIAEQDGVAGMIHNRNIIESTGSVTSDGVSDHGADHNNRN